MNQEEVKKAVRKVFSEYLEKNEHRKTNERYTILEEIYMLNEHFDVEQLFSYLKSKNYNVSKVIYVLSPKSPIILRNRLQILMPATYAQHGTQTSKFEVDFEV